MQAIRKSNENTSRKQEKKNLKFTPSFSRMLLYLASAVARIYFWNGRRRILLQSRNKYSKTQQTKSERNFTFLGCLVISCQIHIIVNNLNWYHNFLYSRFWVDLMYKTLMNKIEGKKNVYMTSKGQINNFETDSGFKDRSLCIFWQTFRKPFSQIQDSTISLGILFKIVL